MERKAWDKLDDESLNAHHAFQMFLHQEKPRALARLAREIGLAEITVAKYRAKYNWYERAEAYDNWKYEQMSEADIDRTVGVLDNKGSVIRDELEDYQLLRQLWLKSVDAVMNDPEVVKDSVKLANTLSTVTNVRAKIDEMARKAVELPSSYTKKVNLEAPVEAVEPDTIQLSMTGPKFLMRGEDASQETN